MTVFKKPSSRGGVRQEGPVLFLGCRRSGTVLVGGEAPCQPSARTDSSTQTLRRLGVEWGGGGEGKTNLFVMVHKRPREQASQLCQELALSAHKASVNNPFSEQWLCQVNLNRVGSAHSHRTRPVPPGPSPSWLLFKENEQSIIGPGSHFLMEKSGQPVTGRCPNVLQIKRHLATHVLPED